MISAVTATASGTYYRQEQSHDAAAWRATRYWLTRQYHGGERLTARRHVDKPDRQEDSRYRGLFSGLQAFLADAGFQVFDGMI